MSIPKLHASAAFGINIPQRTPHDPFVFVDDATIVYTAGTNLVKYNFRERKQQILPCTAASSAMVLGLAISPDCQRIGVIVKEQRATVLFVDVAKFAAKQTLYRVSDSADGKLPVIFIVMLHVETISPDTVAIA